MTSDDPVRDRMQQLTLFPITDELGEHEAVRKFGTGMTSEDYASFQEALSSFARSRITESGALQYDLGNRQQFENHCPEEMADYILEEYADIINYVSQMAIFTVWWAKKYGR